MTCKKCSRELVTFNDGGNPSYYCPECYYKDLKSKRPTKEEFDNVLRYIRNNDSRDYRIENKLDLILDWIREQLED